MNNEIYLIVKRKTIHHAGDERSRTHPGHGYPAYTEEFDEVIKHTNYIDFYNDVVRRKTAGQTFQIFKATEMFVETKIAIN